MREAITTWLEVAGLLLISAAAAVAVARFTLAGGLATGGVLLIGCSGFVAWRAPKPRRSDESTTA